MKIYFAGSIRGGRIDVLVYQSMIAYLSPGIQTAKYSCIDEAKRMLANFMKERR